MKLTSGALTMMISKYRAVLKKMFANNNISLRKSVAVLTTGFIMTAAVPGMATLYTVPEGGYLALSDMAISNQTTSSNGGAILLRTGSTLDLKGISRTFTFQNNSAYSTTGVASSGRGGAIYASTNSTANFDGDFLFYGNKGGSATTAYGGAIYANTGAILNFNNGNVTFTSNSAGSNVNRAGAIYLAAGAVANFDPNGTYQFNYNGIYLDSGASANFYGDFLFNSGNIVLRQGSQANFDGKFVFKNNEMPSSITTNTSGGAINIYLSSPTLKGEYTFTNNNVGNGNGGAINILGQYQTLTLDGSFLFEGNTASAVSGTSGYRMGYGGAIDVGSGNPGTDGVNLDFGENGKYLFKNNEAYRGGGAIYISVDNTANLKGEFEFIGNKALGNSDASTSNTVRSGGAIAVDSYAAANFEGDFLFKENETANSSSGGAICLAANSTATFNGNFVFENNKTFNNGTGGAMLIGSDTVLKGNYRFTANKAGNHGGAVQAANIALDGYAEFINNTSGHHGGAVYSSKEFAIGSDSEAFFAGNSNIDSVNGNIFNKYSSALRATDFTMENASILRGEGGFAAENFSLQNATIAPENGDITLTRIDTSNNIRPFAVTDFNNMTVRGKNGNLFVTGGLDVYNNLTVSGAKLYVSEDYRQRSDSHLILTANADRSAIINVSGNATLTGTYEVNGIGDDAATASSISNKEYTLIHANGVITDSGFTSGASSSLDYILLSGTLANSNRDYNVKTSLAWNDASGKATGNFTIDAGNSFEVDVVLVNNLNPGSGWDGKSLTKNGAGELILSKVNEYTGATTINDGTLTLGIGNAIEASGSVALNGGKIVFAGYDQTLNNLSGAGGSVDLGSKTLTANNSVNTVFGGVIGGVGNLTKTGAGMLTLSGANTYTGVTTVSAGALTLNAADAVKNSREVIVTGGGIVFGSSQTLNNLSGAGGSAINLGAYTLTTNNNANTDFGGAIGGAGGLVKTGSGILTLSGANSYTGATTVNAGTLTLDAKDAIAQSGQIMVNSGSQLVLGNDQTLNKLSGGGNISLTDKNLTVNNEKWSDTTVFGGIISGEGKLVKDGAGTLTLTGDNTYTGGTVISGGELQIGDGTSGGVKGDIENNASLVFQNNADTVYAGTLSVSGNDGSMLKGGTGTLTLTGEGSRQLGVTVAGGTLAIGAAGAEINFSTTDGYGTNAGATTEIGAGSSLNVGGKFTQENNAKLILTANADRSAVITVGGDADLAGLYEVTGIGDGNVAAKASELDRDSYVLIQTTGGTITDSNFTNSGDFGSTGLDYLLQTGGVSTDNKKYEIKFALAWNDVNRKATGDFTLDAGNSFEVDVILANNVSPGSGWDGKSLTKKGAGELILSKVNEYTGMTTVNGGTLALGVANAIAASGEVVVNSGGKIVFDSGDQTLKNLSGGGGINLNDKELTASNTKDTVFNGVIDGAGSLVKTGANALTLSKANTYTGATTVNSGILKLGEEDTIAANGEVIVENDGTIVFDGYAQTLNNLSGDGNIELGDNKLTANNTTGTSTTFAGVIDGGGNLVKTGAGELTLSGVNNYTGVTTVNGGTLALNAADAIKASGEVIISSGSRIVFDGYDQTLNNLSGGGNIASNNQTLTANNTKNTVFSGEINGKGDFVKTGADKTLTLSGAVYDVGETTVAGGTLKIGDTGTATVFIADGGYTTQENATTEIGAGSALIVDGAFTQAENAHLILTANADRSAVISVEGDAYLDGTYEVTGIGSGAAPAKAGGLAASNYILVETTGGGKITDNGFTNTGGIGSTGLDYLLQTGGVNIDEDKYEIKFALAWNDVNGNATGNFTVVQGTSFEIDTGFGLGDKDANPTKNWDGTSLTKNGAGDLILSTTNSYTGATTVNEGTLTLGIEDAIAASGEVIVNNGGQIIFDSGDQKLKNLSGGGGIELGNNKLTAFNNKDTTFIGVIDGAGSLVKDGGGKLTLTGSNTYDGGTTVSGGTLQIGDGATGSITGNIENNASLVFNNNGDSSYDGVLSGGGALTKDGDGKLTFTATNSEQGDVNVVGGTLQIGSDGQAVDFTATGDYTARAGTTTEISIGSQLNVKTFTQENGANLVLTANNGHAVITATGDVSLAGSYEVTGIGGDAAAKASELDINKYVLIATDTGTITDNGFTNTIGINPSGLDYLLHTGGVNDDKDKYEIKFSLAWNAANENATGSFTVASGTEFEVDVQLANNTFHSGGWSGDSLSKNGAGNLILSAINIYDGATIVNEGTLTLKTTNAIATSDEVVVSGSGQIVFDTGDQTLNNLSGGGGIELGGNKLTTVNNKDTTFAGIIDGTGNLVKNGGKALTLTGANTYTGTTTVNDGILNLGAEDTIAASGEVIVETDGTIVFDGYDQTLNNLSGGGNIELRGNTLTANNTDNTTFGGVIGIANGLTRSGDAGGLVKTGDGTLTLTSAISYTGATTVKDGELKLDTQDAIKTSGEVIVENGGKIAFAGSSQTLNNLSGDGNIDSNGQTLIANNTKDTVFSGEIVGNGDFVKTGSDTTLTLSGAVYNVGETNVAGGTFKIGDIGAETDFNADGGYTIQAGATTEISAGSTLTVIGDFTQNTGANLILTAGSQAAVSVIGNATLSGTYEVNDTEATKASDLGQREYILIHATGVNGITNNSSVSSSLDYILLNSGFENGDTDYKVTTSLAWNDGSGNATGSFTLAEGKSFEVDEVLENNTSVTHAGGWDGKSLTKDGLGELILSEVNEYSGKTDIQAGILTLGATDAIATSGKVFVNDNSAVLLYKENAAEELVSYNQTFNNLAGGGLIYLGEAKLTVNNAASDDAQSNGDSEFSGSITGAGSLVKTGEGVLTLSGASDYGGGTVIETGKIIATTGEALSRSNLEIKNAAILEFFIDEEGIEETFRGNISGSENSTLIKNGNGQLTLRGEEINHQGITQIDQGALIIASDGVKFGTIENWSVLSFARNYSGENQNYSLTVDHYAGDGLINLNAYVNEENSWTDFLNFTEMPDNIVNIGFNFANGTNFSYLFDDTLNFAEVGTGEETADGTAANDGQVFKLRQVNSTGLIGVNELSINADGNKYYLVKSVNSSATKAYAEALGGSASQMAAMFDTPLFAGLRQAGAAAKDGYTGVYFEGGRADYRHKTGSHADIKGNAFTLALAWEKEKTTYGIFGQMFNGNYQTAHNGQTQAGAVTIHANGSLKSHDAGLFATYVPGRQAGSDGGDTGAYYTTVLKTGRSTNKFDGGSDLGGSTFESGKGTFGYSIGGGYVKETGPGRKVDYYGHLVYSRLNSDEVIDSLGQTIKMDAVNSLRLLSGVQWTLNADKPVSTIIRTGLDYEFRGESVAYINGARAESANLKGLTGILELGFSAKRGKNIAIDGTIQGFVGKKSGLAGSLALKAKF